MPRGITLSLLCWLGHGLTKHATRDTQERDFTPEDALPRALYLYKYLYLYRYLYKYLYLYRYLYKILYLYLYRYL